MGINSTVVKSYVYELVTKGDVVDTVTIRAKSLKKVTHRDEATVYPDGLHVPLQVVPIVNA